MKKIKIVLIMLLVLMALNIRFAGSISGETRNIYIGDTIELKIESLDYTDIEIEEAFSAFEILEQKRVGDGVELILKCFTIGEQKLKLGDQEITIVVASTLDDISGEGLFEGNHSVKEPGWLTNPYSVLWLLLAITCICSALYAIGKVQKKQLQQLTSIAQFRASIKRLDKNDSRYLVALTQSVKGYITKTFLLNDSRLSTDKTETLTLNTDSLPVDKEQLKVNKEQLIEKKELLIESRIEKNTSESTSEKMSKKISVATIGLTTEEFLKIIEPMEALSASFFLIKEWLEQCDYIKFSGKDLTDEMKENLYKNAVTMVENLNETILIEKG